MKYMMPMSCSVWARLSSTIPMPGSCMTMLEARTAGVTPRSLAASLKASSSFRIPRSSPAQLKISEPSSSNVTLPMTGLCRCAPGPRLARSRDSFGGGDRVRGFLRQSERTQPRHLVLESLALLRDLALHVVVALLAVGRHRLRRAPRRIGAFRTFHARTPITEADRRARGVGGRGGAAPPPPRPAPAGASVRPAFFMLDLLWRRPTGGPGAGGGGGARPPPSAITPTSD